MLIWVEFPWYLHRNQYRDSFTPFWYAEQKLHMTNPTPEGNIGDDEVRKEDEPKKGSGSFDVSERVPGKDTESKPLTVSDTARLMLADASAEIRAGQVLQQRSKPDVLLGGDDPSSPEFKAKQIIKEAWESLKLQGVPRAPGKFNSSDKNWPKVDISAASQQLQTKSGDKYTASVNGPLNIKFENPTSNQGFIKSIIQGDPTYGGDIVVNYAPPADVSPTEMQAYQSMLSGLAKLEIRSLGVGLAKIFTFNGNPNGLGTATE